MPVRSCTLLYGFSSCLMLWCGFSLHAIGYPWSPFPKKKILARVDVKKRLVMVQARPQGSGLIWMPVVCSVAQLPLVAPGASAALSGERDVTRMVTDLLTEKKKKNTESSKNPSPQLITQIRTASSSDLDTDIFYRTFSQAWTCVIATVRGVTARARNKQRCNKAALSGRYNSPLTSLTFPPLLTLLLLLSSCLPPPPL